MCTLQDQTFKNVCFGIGISRLGLDMKAEDSDLRDGAVVAKLSGSFFGSL